MSLLSRRRFVKTPVLIGASGWNLNSLASDLVPSPNELHLATFRFDVTPPIGHSLCGGWIKPVIAVDDPLEAIGVVFVGAGKPIVICAVDWTGLLNDAHLHWRQTLATAVGTTPDRVAVQCVHQHNAPLACLGAEQIVSNHQELPHIVEPEFFRDCLARAKKSAREAMHRLRPVTHMSHGQAKIEKVASNRRVARDATGKITRSRSSSCKNATLRALPEGLIDPWLKTVSFFHHQNRLAALHYYATHPMSYYGDGRVSSDFVGLARKRRQRDEPDVTHIYFTGCAGDIAAGKYNDGSPQNRKILADRIYNGMIRADRQTKWQKIDSLKWFVREILPTPRGTLSATELEQRINDKANSVVDRNRPSYMLSWLRRHQRKLPIVLSCLRVNDTSLLHLPAECFVAYQLRAQQFAPNQFVATSAYGDGGPWYIPIQEEYSAGGYEVSVAFCDPEVDATLTKAIQKLLGA